MILLSEGRIFFIELKKSGEALSKAQGPWIRLLRRLGFQAMKIEGEEELKKFIFWNIT